MRDPYVADTVSLSEIRQRHAAMVAIGLDEIGGNAKMYRGGRLERMWCQCCGDEMFQYRFTRAKRLGAVQYEGLHGTEVCLSCWDAATKAKIRRWIEV